MNFLTFTRYMDNLIPISALNHYAFCPRRCAYIHIERIWQDNFFTAQGNQLHERVHSTEAETRGNLRTERKVQVSSEKWGLVGMLDLLEIQHTPYCLTPVEYKRGKPKVQNCDRVQLCAQALCLEEMQNIRIKKAALWYWQVRKRQWITLTDELRQQTEQVITATRQLLSQNSLPKAVYSTSCKACSFLDICNPKQKDRSSAYLDTLFNAS